MDSPAATPRTFLELDVRFFACGTSSDVSRHFLGPTQGIARGKGQKSAFGLVERQGRVAHLAIAAIGHRQSLLDAGAQPGCYRLITSRLSEPGCKELGMDYGRRVVPADDPQARCLACDLRVSVNADSNYVGPVIAILDQLLGLLAGRQELGMVGLSPIGGAGSFHGVGEQPFECLGAFLHESSVQGRRIARSELRAGTPKVVRSDEKHGPVPKQRVHSPALSGSTRRSGTGLSRKRGPGSRRNAPNPKRFQDRPFVLLEVTRRQYPPGVVRDVGKIARGREVAKAGDSASHRAVQHICSSGPFMVDTSLRPGARGESRSPLNVITRVDRGPCESNVE